MFATLSKPYAIAGQTIAETATSTYKMLSSFAIATYKTLTSEKTQHVYRDAWTITRVVVQVTALALYAAGLCTIIAGRKFRAYYEAEWAADVGQWTQSACRWLIMAGLYAAIAGYEFRAYCDAKLATATEAEATVEVSTDTAQHEIPAAVQAILESNVKTTKKLRAIATYFDIPWRNAHGEGRHLRNDEIRSALSDHPEVLTALEQSLG